MAPVARKLSRECSDPLPLPVSALCSDSTDCRSALASAGPRVAPTWAGPRLVAALNHSLVPGSRSCPSQGRVATTGGSWLPLRGGGGPLQLWEQRKVSSLPRACDPGPCFSCPPVPSGGRHEEQVNLGGASTSCCRTVLQTHPGRGPQERGPVCACSRLSPELSPVGSRWPFPVTHHQRTGAIHASPGPSLPQLRSQDSCLPLSRGWACLLQPRPHHRLGRLLSCSVAVLSMGTFLCPPRREEVWGPLN